MKKVVKTLGDHDKKTLGEIGKQNIDETPFKFKSIGDEDKKFACPDINCWGIVELVKPEIFMAEMSLYECPVCKNRKYV